MRTRVFLLVIGFAITTALMWPIPAAYAIPIPFVSHLSGTSEVPPVSTPGTGFTTVVLDPTARTIQIDATFTGLTSPTNAAHIHCCAPAGTNVGVATTIPAFPGFPLGVTAGNYSSAVFDLTQPLIYNPAFVTLQGGLTQAEAALITGMLNGLSYLNIHTVNFPGGEIRGQLEPVPEPTTLLLFGTTAAGLGLARWRRWRRTPRLES